MLVLAGLAGSSLFAPLAHAQEPLFLRIRPNNDDGAAARARALREEVWARSDRRARIAIASVCTGCMKPLPPPPTAGGLAGAPDVVGTGSFAGTSHVSSPAGDP
jgi:hypothetical protein